GVNPDKVYREINWALLVLFAGLFIITAGLEHSGATERLLSWAAAMNLHRPIVLTVVTALVSNVVSNVPAVLLFKPLIVSFGDPRRAWLVLAMASTLAGNLTGRSREDGKGAPRQKVHRRGPPVPVSGASALSRERGGRWRYRRDPYVSMAPVPPLVPPLRVLRDCRVRARRRRRVHDSRWRRHHRPIDDLR